jgi:hypothetical protein
MLRAGFFGEHAMRASTECVLGSLPYQPAVAPHFRHEASEGWHKAIARCGERCAKRSPGAASDAQSDRPAQSGQPVSAKLNVPLLHTSTRAWLEVRYTLIVPVKVPCTVVVLSDPGEVVLNDPCEVVTKRPL